MSASIQIIRYVFFPLTGLLAGWGVMCWRARWGKSYDQINSVRTEWGLLAILGVGIVVMGGLVTLRYATWHSFVFDLGSYDQKAWLIARESSWWGMWQQTYKGGVDLSPCGIDRYWGICHFQPWLLVPGLIYKVWDSPLVLLWFQVLLVTSGVIPVFLLARDRFDSPIAGMLAGVLFLLYPPVQYNGVVDYRPDHVAIPTMLWAYFLAGRGQYLASLGVASLAGLAKETLILNAAFFGLYLAVRHRQRMMGGVAFFLGMTVFCLVMFHLLQFNKISEGQFMLGRYFPGLSHLVHGTPKIMISVASIVQGLMQTHKWLYLEALFVPLALIPLLALGELIPAVPSLAISLLSVNPNFASIDEQYSASVVAPAFAALLAAIARLREIRGPRMAPVPALAGLIVLSAFVSFGLSPSPLSLNFWDHMWGGRWHGAQYLPDRQRVLDRAASLVPADPKVIVATQNDVNSSRLAHRYHYFAFPNAIERADYVLLDTARAPYVNWMWNPRQYHAILKYLLTNPAYQVISDEEGVLLFKRVRLSTQAPKL